MPPSVPSSSLCNIVDHRLPPSLTTLLPFPSWPPFLPQTPNHRFSLSGIFFLTPFPPGTFGSLAPGDILDCPNRRKGVATGIWWVEVEDAANRLPEYRTAPATNDYEAQNTNHAALMSRHPAQSWGPFSSGPKLLISSSPKAPT